RLDVLAVAEPGAVLLLDSPWGPAEVWDHLPRLVQAAILDKGLRLFVIDGHRVARETGMGGRANTVMQTCFFAGSGVLPRAEAVAAIKRSIEKTYGKRGEAVVRKNFAAVDATLDHLHEGAVPSRITSPAERRAPVGAEAPDFVRRLSAPSLLGGGDRLPVSAFPADGAYPSATARWEKRGIAAEIPVWGESLCIQCGDRE